MYVQLLSNKVADFAIYILINVRRNSERWMENAYEDKRQWLKKQCNQLRELCLGVCIDGALDVERLE